MTLHLQVLDEPFGTYTDFDLVANCVKFTGLEISTSSFSSLRFTVSAPQHTTPIARYAFIRFWDDAGVLPDSTPQDATHPLFEGFCEEVKGTESNIVEYTAYDPTRFAGKMAPVMSAAWSQGTIATLTRPAKATGVVTRRIDNCKNDADDDYAFERTHDSTAGGLIASILDDQYHPLYWINAAPGDGTDAGNGTAYVWTGELDQLTTKPQEKLVFESDTVRNAVSQVLTRFYPEWRMLFVPGSASHRRWRFWTPTLSPEQTITLNDPTASPKVISGSIEPTTEGRFTAVEFRGPETTVIELFTWVKGGGSNTLGPIGSPVVLETVGAVNIEAYLKWQIVDATKRRGAKLLPEPYQIVMNNNIVSYRGPVLQISFDGGTTWTSTNTWFDHYNGIAYWDSAIYWWSDKAGAQGERYHPPNAVRLLWAYYTDPIVVRKPTTGFEGNAYTLDGLQAEYSMYDEALAVGYEYGTPVTTAAREAQFATLAQSILDERKDTAWIGSLVLNGLDYSFAWLQKRINITALDEDGAPLTTGWEAIKAWLTSVSYDFENRLTTISFNSDQMANLGISEELLKERLKIRALEQRIQYSGDYIYRDYVNYRGEVSQQITGVVETSKFFYVDPETGERG